MDDDIVNNRLPVKKLFCLHCSDEQLKTVCGFNTRMCF